MTIQLSWQVNSVGTSQKVYRSLSAFTSSALPTPLATLSANAFSYEDDTATDPDDYFYMIETVSGAVSAFSNLISVTIEEPVSDGYLGNLYDGDGFPLNDSTGAALIAAG